MHITYLLIIVGLVITNLYSLYYLNRQRKFTIQLFNRAWTLEKKLIHIYNESSPDVQRDITDILHKITPL